MPYLKNEIENMNRYKKIKIRLNKIVSGYSIFLEYNKDYRRERKFLPLQISGSKILGKKDRETLFKVEVIRDKREIELFGKSEDFALQPKSIQANFLEYFEIVANKTKLPSYIGSLRQLKEFANQKYNDTYIKFNSIDVIFCTNFREFLLDKITQKKLANPTAKTYMTVFAAVLNRAYNEKIISSNPAARIRIKAIDAKREYLTEEELKLFMQAQTKYTEIKNAFLFSSQTSLRLGDIRALTYNDIRVNNDHEAYLYFRQQKTKGISHIKLSKLAFEIFQEQKSNYPDRENVFVLPSSRSNINDRLIEMAESVGIKKHIHYHLSRHSWATLALSRNVNIYTVSKIMGHKTVSTTEIYSNLINKKRDEVADIINLELTEEDKSKHQLKMSKKLKNKFE